MNFSIGKIKPETKDELIDLIYQSIKMYGTDCDLNFIDTSLITDMCWLFYHIDEFNGDISKWNTSNVTNMEFMFYGSDFNGDISEWDTGNVTTMEGMFFYSNFNGDISKWNVNKVTDKENMFYYYMN